MALKCGSARELVVSQGEGLDHKMEVDEEQSTRLATITEYTVPDENRAAFEEEIQTWIKDDWLIPYPPRMGISGICNNTVS